VYVEKFLKSEGLQTVTVQQKGHRSWQ